MSSAHPVALVIGGGIAGPLTALALQHVGFEPIVFEAYPRQDADVGSYFSITPNGLDVLRSLDVLHLATAIGIPTRANVLWNERGRRLGEVSLGRPLADGTPSLTMKRSTLGRAVQDEATRRGIRVAYAKRLLAVLDAPDGRVVAEFEDGSHETGDLLVGADGIHSRVRRAIDPAAPGGRFVGLTNFGGYTRVVPAGLEKEPGVWHMIFGQRAFFGYMLAAAGGAVWFANVPRQPISSAERAATSAEGWRVELMQAFEADVGPAVDLIRDGELELVGDNTYDLPHVPTWHRGRLIVIGDAAHAPSPSSGQGASLAMEDAVVLAACLRDAVDATAIDDADGGVRTPNAPLPAAVIGSAFEAYERVRRERVEKIVAQGARTSSAKVPGRFGRVMRDLMLRMAFRFFVTDRSLAWMYDYRAA